MNQPWGTPPPPPAAAAAGAPIGEQLPAETAAEEQAPPRPRTPGGLAPLPARDVPLGVPASAVYGEKPTRIVEVPAHFAAEDVARAWVQHVKLVAQDFRAIVSVLPHGDVVKVLAEAGPVVEAIAAGL